MAYPGSWVRDAENLTSNNIHIFKYINIKIIKFNIINQINHTYLPNAMPNMMRLDTLEVFRQISK